MAEAQSSGAGPSALVNSSALYNPSSSGASNPAVDFSPAFKQQQHHLQLQQHHVLRHQNLQQQSLSSASTVTATPIGGTPDARWAQLEQQMKNTPNANSSAQQQLSHPVSFTILHFSPNSLAGLGLLRAQRNPFPPDLHSPGARDQDSLSARFIQHTQEESALISSLTVYNRPDT
jgi:hypothetical protein